MLISSVRLVVLDRWSTSIDTSKFARLVASAMRYYSRWNPRVVETTLTTVADQQFYDLPSGCIGVREAYWHPSGSPYSTVWANREAIFSLRQPERYFLPSERVIEDINEEAYEHALTGRWEFLSGQGQLCITPEPTVAGTEFPVVYYAEHQINAGATGYETIPDADLDILANLVLAEVIEAEVLVASVSPDYAEGLERETFRFIPSNAGQVVSDLRRSGRGKYGGATVGVSPP